MRDGIESKVIEMLAKAMSLNIEEVNANSSTDNLEVWDSMNHMKLVMFLEEEFDIHFSEEQIVAEMLSCQQITDIIEETRNDN